ncbi:MAG TPA: tetratricopeptide repeat protein, partial [Isosphaeraceae bacterium]|nr:tetratricopeptide repeat protein [Isosphaeraceae bacterium]
VLRLMVEDRKKPPSARSLNSDVPHSLDSILKMCLDPEPCFRYHRAGELAEDLRRFLDDRPLAHAPEPSLTESAAKWLRRHPEARSSTTIGLLATFLIISVAGLTWFVADQYEAQAEGYRRNQFASAFRECQILLNTSSGPRSHWGRGLELANRELRDFGLFNLDPGAPTSSAWQPAMPHLLESDRRALSEELAELILLKVRCEVALANGQSERKRRAVLTGALPWLDRAEVIDPEPPSALYQERARLKAALGRSLEAAGDREKAAKRPPRTARDYYLLGTASASDGHLESAEAFLSRAVALDSRRFWAWFALGLCHFDQGRFAEAATDFAACTILAPTFAWPHLNRGLSLARLGRLTEAQAAYDQALAVNPDFLQARIDRALCELELNMPKSAEQDLAHALRLG